MKHKNLHITIFSLLIWSFNFAQQYTNYSTKDGLPSNHVYTIVQDAKGFIWFLTDKGMVRYNGNQFKSFTTKNGLPINDVWDAFPAPDGKVWYMCKSSKLGYINNDTIISFPNKNKDEIINPIFTSQLGDSIYPTDPNKTFSLKNNQWIGETNIDDKKTNEDLIKIRNIEVAYISINFDTEDLNLYNKNFKKTTTVSAKDLRGGTGARGQINDSLYFWTVDKSYTILNLNTQKIKHVNLQDAIGISDIKHLRINLVGDGVQISGSGFVAKLNENFEVINPFFFPKHIQAHFGFIDKLNNVWLATFNNGVYKLPYAKRDVKFELQNEKILSFDVIDNDLVAGVYNKGFYKYNKTEKSFKPFMKSDGYVFGASKIEPLNTIFYSLKNSLVKEIDGKQTKINLSSLYEYGAETNEVARKLVYFNDKLYGNFSFGINRINPSPFTIEKEYSQKGCNGIINFKNRLLIATTNGLKEIKNDSIVEVDFNTYSLKKSILSLKKIDNTHLLINTDGFGAYITDMTSIQPLPKTEFLIVEEAFVENTTIWLATNFGVLKYVKNKEFYKLNKTYTISDGLPTNLVNTIYVTNKNLVVGTNHGIAILPKKQQSVSQLLDVYIEKAKYNNEDITTTHSVFKYQENNKINFTVSNIDFSEKHSNFSYDYKLEPIQKEWTNSKINSFNFNDLHAGKYTFYVKSNNIQKTLDFKIKPLWYQRVSLKILALLLSILLIVYLSRIFVKRSQFKKNQKIFEDKRLSELQLKALRSQMNPHFVFNSLSAIQYYINDNNYEASETYLVKFSKLIRQFFELSKENEIPLTREVNLLKSYLDIEKLRFREKLNYVINVDKKLNTETTLIPTMLLQPIVENAVNHGIFNKLESGFLTLNFLYVDEQTFKVEIIDDGVGFENTKKRHNTKVKSSSVLIDRLHFLNQSRKWYIKHNNEEVSPNKEDKGNKSIFIIKHTVNE